MVEEKLNKEGNLKYLKEEIIPAIDYYIEGTDFRVFPNVYTYYNGNKEHESYSERYAADMKFAEREACGGYHGQHYDRLCGRICAEKPVYPVHCYVIDVMSVRMWLTGGKICMPCFHGPANILCKDSSSCRHCKEKTPKCMFYRVLYKPPYCGRAFSVNCHDNSDIIWIALRRSLSLSFRCRE